MAVYAADERGIVVVLCEPTHDKVYLSLVLALRLDFSMVASEVLGEVLLESRPYKLLSVEHAAVSREKNDFEGLVVPAHLSTVVSGQIVND